MNVKEAREIVNRPRIVEPETLRSAIKHKNLADKMHLSLDELRSFAAGYLAALEGSEVKELLVAAEQMLEKIEYECSPGNEIVDPWQKAIDQFREAVKK